MQNYESFMREALSLAHTAKNNHEVPVGAIVVLNSEIIGRGCNCPISTNDPTAHAEIIALRDAAKTIGNYRLVNAALVVTLEPCVMCFSAMIHARIKKLIFGALDPKAGANSVFELFNSKKFNHQIDWVGQILENECRELLVNFFQAKR